MSRDRTDDETAAVLVSQDGPILRITLNRPERKNALSGAGDVTRVIVLRAAGADF